MVSWVKNLIEKIHALVTFLTYSMDYNKIENGLQECDKAIRRITDKLKHASSVGEKQRLTTALANIKSSRTQLKSLIKKGGSLKETAKHRVHWDDNISAFTSRIHTGIIINLKHKDPKHFLEDARDIFKYKIHAALKDNIALKVNTVFCGEFILQKADRFSTDFKYFTTSNSPIFRDTNIHEWFDNKVTQPMLKELEEFQEKDSGWALKNIVNLGVNINKFTPQLGSSYIELPEQIKKKQACVNVKNDDEACFAWAVTSALYPVDKHPQRVSKYPHYSNVLKLRGIQYPMTMRQIPNFEKQNEISINVYILKKNKKEFITLPTYLTKNKRDRHVNLLLIQDNYDNAQKYHFVWIKSLSRLLSKQLSEHKTSKYFCDRCLRYFYSQNKLKSHTEDCQQLNEEAVRMPYGDKAILKFKNFSNKEKVPFIVYADLESVLKKNDDPKKFQEHIPASVGYYLKCSFDDSLSLYKSHRGLNCMQWFADEMERLAKDMETVFWCPYDIDISSQQEIEFKMATHCHICEKPFEVQDVKVRDHNHLIPVNNYRGASHQDCNINYKDSYVVPVVFHNLSGYDANFIIEDIATRIDGTIDLLPITKEKYISFTKHLNDSPIKFRFIDSFRFMCSSLDTLSSYLKKFPNLKSQFPELTEEQFKLLTKKGVMPYDYIDSVDRFDETSLPSIDNFYNKLEEKPCPRRLYHRAQQVWNIFCIPNLGSYLDLYMKTDILLLADVFEQFRTSCHITYGLDPANYFTLPGYTWDAMLKYTNQELELLSDPDMFLFVEKGIRGGLSQVCSKRRAHANNKYIPNYDATKPESYQMYYDVNNQYGWAMSQYLPYGGFTWDTTNIDVTTIADDSDEGYILEVDLEYPENLHDLHKDLPFCPLHIDPKTRKPPKTTSQITKLMATLYPKEKYVIHYRALKQALAHGLILKKIHRVLKFKQSPWLKSYIDLNTKLRMKATNDFEKNLFKLMNNAVFGKTMENIRKRVKIRLVSQWHGRYGAEAYISKPEFKSCTIFNENLVAIELKKLQIYLNKPIYVGMSILDLAKTTIYNFHYDYMMSHFGEGCTLLYTDTDSLIYETALDPYEFIKQDCYKYFDTSDYTPNNIYNIPLVNKKVLGKMKDENNGTIMTDFIGLRSKMYVTKILKTVSEKEEERLNLLEKEYEEDEIYKILENIDVTKKAKGIKKSVVKNNITFNDYVDCLENVEAKSVNQNLIRQEKHSVYSISQKKIALDSWDDKRYLIKNSYHTLPWGHYTIPEETLDKETLDEDD